MLVHQGLESIIVIAHEQVDQLVDDEVFEAFWRLLHQLEVLKKSDTVRKAEHWEVPTEATKK